MHRSPAGFVTPARSTAPVVAAPFLRLVVAPVLTLVLALVVGLAGGCGDGGGSPPPAPEGPQSGSLSGQIVLISQLSDLSNHSMGEGRLEDADGVLVELTGPGGARDSALTDHGRYEFGELAPGTYRVRSWVIPGEEQTTDSTGEIAVGRGNRVVPDTLILRPSGVLSTYPNPAVDEGVTIEFTAGSAEMVQIEVRSLDGALVWHDSQQVSSPGSYQALWIGHDSGDHEVQSGAYWVLVKVDGQWAYNLVFWPGHEPVGGTGNCGHIEANGLLVSDHHEILVSSWRNRRQGELKVGVGQVSHEYQITFLSPDSVAFAIADTCPENRLSWTIADPTVATVRLAEGSRWSIELVGKRAGNTELTLLGWHQEHVHFSSPPIPIVVQ